MTLLRSPRPANPTVGDLAGNAALVRKARADAAARGAELIVFPELFTTGYPPEDLILKPAFAAARDLIEDLARDTADGGPGMLIGTPWPGPTSRIIPPPCSTAARSRRAP